jgi:hypothetical protein
VGEKAAEKQAVPRRGAPRPPALSSTAFSALSPPPTPRSTSTTALFSITSPITTIAKGSATSKSKASTPIPSMFRAPPPAVSTPLCGVTAYTATTADCGWNSDCEEDVWHEGRRPLGNAKKLSLCFKEGCNLFTHDSCGAVRGNRADGFRSYCPEHQAEYASANMRQFTAYRQGLAEDIVKNGPLDQ